MKANNKIYFLRDWNKEDAESLALHLNNKKIWDNCRDNLPFPYSSDNARFFIENIANNTCNEVHFCISIEGKAVGNICFMRKNDVERFTAEIGYWLSEAYWNAGIMTNALSEAISYYFAKHNVVRLYVEVFSHNHASMRVIEKLHFRKVGIMQNAAYKSNCFLDIHCYEFLRR